MFKFSRTICIIVLVVFVFAVGLTGCSKTDETSQTTTKATTQTTTQTTAGSSETTAADPFAEKLEILWCAPADYTIYKEDNFVEKTLEERFNVELKVMPINTWDEEKLTVTIAAGSAPDVFVRWAHQKYFTDGIIKEVPEDLLAQYWPTGKMLMETVGGKMAYELMKSYETNKLIWVPGVNPMGNAPWVTAVRQDWMENVGITKIPETLDEMYELAKAFRNNDPDKNGIKDTYFYGGGSDHWAWNYFWAQTNGAFGWVPNIWVEEDGMITNTYISESYKEMLKYYAKWYEEGLIDPEFATDKFAILNAKVVDGKVGTYFGMANDYNLANTPVDLAIQKNPSAKWAVISKIVGPDGDFGTWSYGTLSWATGFGANTSDEKIIRAMQMLEAMDTDLELNKITLYGQEGVDYDINADGKAVAKADVKAGDRGIGYFYSSSRDTMEKNYLLSGKTTVDQAKLHMGNTKILGNVINNVLAEFISQNDPSADFASWFNIPKEFYVKAVTGKIDIDKEWDSYVAAWKKAVGPKVLEEVQKMERFDK